MVRAGVETNDHDEELRFVTHAIRLKPEFFEAFYNRAIARYAKGDWDGALSDYTEAIRLERDFAEALNNRGNVRKAAGDLDGADISWNASTFKLRFQTPAEVTAELERMPVNTVVLETRNGQTRMPHHALLARAMQEYPERWMRIHEYCAAGAAQGCADRFEVFALRAPRPGPQDVQVDLRNRIGRVLGAAR